ncbi:hypothetical protein RhiirA4_487114 [Rhizophagus irregularis]|uniref:Uncharacterized protein n=1 Tax=Rhizophagus irregularis TaxID=588596 RepID=A0A2I1HSE9_9GLOM|nr:hypothetical protein RhiirA4_487114 [Rhizophagus irregularis]
MEHITTRLTCTKFKYLNIKPLKNLCIQLMKIGLVFFVEMMMKPLIMYGLSYNARCMDF